MITIQSGTYQIESCKPNARLWCERTRGQLEILRALRASAVETELSFTAEAQRSRRTLWLYNVQVIDENHRGLYFPVEGVVMRIDRNVSNLKVCA